MKHKIVVISPNPYSRYTLSVLYLLERNDIKIQGVILNKILNLKRIKSEISRDGVRLIRKIYRKLILKSAENPTTNNDNIITYMQKNSMNFVSIPEFCQERNIDLIKTSDINNLQAENFIKERQPNCIIFTGGGLIRENIIKHSGRGVINCHMGILPIYRGMDVVQWPILRGDFNNIGLTTHLMDKSIDTGDIIKRRNIEAKKFSSIGEMRNSMERQMPEFIVNSSIQLLNNEVVLEAQKEDEGKQYFIVNRRLEKYIDKALKKFSNYG
ncbi:MAG: formyltransferase family protein [Emcibacteraceae bacterium]